MSIDVTFETIAARLIAAGVDLDDYLDYLAKTLDENFPKEQEGEKDSGIGEKTDER